MKKTALVLGGTGAMGVYLVPKLVKSGYKVDVVSMDEVVSDNKNLTYIKADATDLTFLKQILSEKYSVIVDYMIYHTPEFLERYKLFLDNTERYIYLSSYRIYDNCPITEGSPRLADTKMDPLYVNSNDYSYYKARQEDILRSSEYKNWTIIRPAITFSKRRFQLVTLEANVLIYRIFNKKTVVLPDYALDRTATMTWAGDVAEMIIRLINNKKAAGETFTVSTSENHTWREIAEYYKEIGGLDYIAVSEDEYLSALSEEENIHLRQQLELDRFFDRVVDNSKVLKFTGLKQKDLMPLKDGLKMEFDNLLPTDILPATEINDRMDALVNKIKAVKG